MFVVITKTVADMDTRPPQHKNSHAEYPLECIEFETATEASDKFPGRKVWSSEEYNGYKLAMNLTHGEINTPKPWWKFWGGK